MIPLPYDSIIIDEQYIKAFVGEIPARAFLMPKRR